MSFKTFGFIVFMASIIIATISGSIDENMPSGIPFFLGALKYMCLGVSMVLSAFLLTGYLLYMDAARSKAKNKENIGDVDRIIAEFKMSQKDLIIGLFLSLISIAISLATIF